MKKVVIILGAVFLAVGIMALSVVRSAQPILADSSDGRIVNQDMSGKTLPGLLGDKLAALEDRLRVGLVGDKKKKMELQVGAATRRLERGRELIDSGEAVMGINMIMKSQKYLGAAVEGYEDGEKGGDKETVGKLTEACETQQKKLEEIAQDGSISAEIKDILEKEAAVCEAWEKQLSD